MKKILSSLLTVAILISSVTAIGINAKTVTEEELKENPNAELDSEYVDTDFWDGTLTPVTGANEEDREWYNFADYSEEIKNDGTFDISELLQDCVNEYDNVFIPAGRYLLTKQISLHTNSGIRGETDENIGRTVFLTSGNNCFFIPLASETENTVENVLVSDFDMENNASARCFALYAYRAYNLTVRNTNTYNGGAVEIFSNCPFEIDYYTTRENDKYLSQNVIISNCNADGGETFFDDSINMYTMVVGIMFTGLRRFVIENCTLTHLQDGICFVGGWPLAENQCEFHNIGKVSDGLITGCTVGNTEGGGIWGCMPYKLYISNNTVHECNDTGIDFEGGAQCIVDGNTVYNARTNFMILDHYTGHFIFRNNHSYFKNAECRYHLHGSGENVTKEYWGTATGNHFYYCDVDYYDYSKGPSAGNQRFIFENNIFESDIISYFGPAHYSTGTLDSCIFRNNTCKNVAFRSVFWTDAIEVDNDDTHYIGRINHFEVTGNTFEFDIPLTDLYPNMLYARVGDSGTPDNPALIVKDNKIIGNGADIGEPAILIEHGVSEKDIYADISGNEVTGFENPIKIINDNSEYKFRVNITDNKCDGIDVLGDIDYYITGNIHSDGSPMATSEMLIDKNYVAPKTHSENNSITASTYADRTYLSINAKEEIIWCSTEKKRIKNTSTGTEADFRLLWENRENQVAFTLLLNVSKKAAFANGEKIVLEMDFGDGEINTLNTRLGTKTSVAGSVFKSEDTAYVFSVSADKDRMNYTYECRLVVSKTEQIKKVIKNLENGNDAFFGFNIRIVEDGKASKSFGWSSNSEATSYENLGKLYLAPKVIFKDISGTEKGDADGDGSITRADLELLTKWVKGYDGIEEIGGGIVVGADMNGDGIVNTTDVELLSDYIEENIKAFYGDVNGDGKIKGNDATQLLKYLADWDVTVNTENSDCNGDDRIKGNDATLLLKYLADWDVLLGKN